MVKSLLTQFKKKELDIKLKFKILGNFITTIHYFEY
jgi:hypothetical protein